MTDGGMYYAPSWVGEFGIDVDYPLLIIYVVISLDIYGIRRLDEPRMADNDMPLNETRT